MPHIAIIGTFKDKCNSETPDYNEMLKRKSAEITECLKPYINNKCGIISHYRKEQILWKPVVSQTQCILKCTLCNAKPEVSQIARRKPPLSLPSSIARFRWMDSRPLSVFLA